MRTSLFLISLALSSAACSDAVDEAPVVPAVAMATALVEASDEGGPKAVAVSEEEERDGGSRSFAYRWPATVSEHPELAKLLGEERDAASASQKTEWENSLSEFPEDCATCKTRSFEKSWAVVTDLPDWLSLSADIQEYTGGAHGMYGKQSLVWDKRGKAAMAGIDLFKSPVALENALGAQLCDALDEAREKRRGAPVERSGEWASDCPGLDEATLFVGSSNGEHFDRIGVYFGPYVAGAYAEGDYELNFPVTASVVDAVKPEFASAFRVKR